MTVFDWVVVVGLVGTSIILFADQAYHTHPTGYIMCELCAKMIVMWLIVLGVLAGIGFLAEELT